MKKAFLAAASLLVLAVAACKKEYYVTSASTNGDTQNVNVVNGAPRYLVGGLQDVVLQKADSGSTPASAFIPLSISYNNGTQERLRLSLEGAPAGLVDSITVPTGYPNFSSALFLADSGVAIGTYPMKLVVAGDSSGRREFAFDVKVTLPRDCSVDILDTPYTASSFCASSSAYPVGVRATGVRNQVRFTNIDNAGGSLLAFVNCTTQTLTIPQQIVNGVTYEGGNGSFFTGGGGGTNKQIFISVQINTGSGTPITCSVSMSK